MAFLVTHSHVQFMCNRTLSAGRNSPLRLLFSLLHTLHVRTLNPRGFALLRLFVSLQIDQRVVAPCCIYIWNLRKRTRRQEGEMWRVFARVGEKRRGVGAKEWRKKGVKEKNQRKNSGIKRRREWKDSKQERPKLLKCPTVLRNSRSISVSISRRRARLFKGREPLKARRFSFITKQTAACAVT